ncbi:MAG: MinD/ParA family protein [Candidatus Anammoxibacter sp.]
MHNMQDQASKLRNISNKRVGGNKVALSRVLAVTSGKGGVGKSNISTNIAIAMAQHGKRILLIDFDLGLANIDILLGIYPQYTLKDVFRGKKELKDIIVEGPEGLMIIPASSGVEEMVNMTNSQKERLVRDVGQIKNGIDLVIVDTGSGIYSDVVRMIVAANEIVIVVTPEPTSITDAYAVVKVVSKYKKQPRIRLIVNMCRNITDAKSTGKRITEASKRFLGVDIQEVFAVPYDQHVERAVRLQKPFLIQFPDAVVSTNIRKIAGNILSVQSGISGQQDVVGIDSYFKSLMNL